MDGRRQILGFGAVLSAGGFCGFRDFGGSKSHLRRLSIGLVSVLKGISWDGLAWRFLRGAGEGRILREREFSLGLLGFALLLDLPYRISGNAI